MLIRAAEEAPKGPTSAFPAACVRLSGLIRKRLMDLMDNFIPSYFISLSPPSPLASLGRHKHGSLCTGGRLCCERNRAARVIREQQVGGNSIRKAIFSPSASGLETISLRGDVPLTPIDFSCVCVRVCL